MKKITYLVLSLMLFGTVSCDKQETAMDPVPGEEIRFSAGFSASLLTKASTIDDVRDFAVFGWNTGETSWTSLSTLPGSYIFNNVQAVKSAGTYVTSGDKKSWEGGKYHFVAYGPYMETSPATFEGAGSPFKLKLKFTDYTTTTSTVDLIYSEFATDKVNSDGIVPLNFYHALSRIKFSFSVVENKMGSEGVGSKITLITIEPVSISLGNFLTQGSFTYDGSSASWASVSTNASITNTAVVQSSDGGYDAYVLPQELADDSSFSLTYNIVYQSSDTEVKAGPFTASNVKFKDDTGGTWTSLEMGKQYEVTVKVNAFNGKIELSAPVVTDWESASGTVETK